MGDSPGGYVVYALDRYFRKQRFSPQECVFEIPLITHSFQFFQRVGVFNRKLPHGGTAEALRSDEAVQRAYLGHMGEDTEKISDV